MPSSHKAYAKINIFLNVLEPRPDGYHQVRFVMQTLNLADILNIDVAGEGHHIALTCTDPSLAQEPDNLVNRAYTLFYKHTQCPPLALDVTLDKHIPIQAGLGGGSSDAACMLMALNKLHQNPLSPAELSTLGSTLGCDVPFFMTGGTCLATERGDTITALPDLPSMDVVLIKPKALGISTQQAYQWLKDQNVYTPIPFDTILEHLNQQSPLPFDQWLYNDFEAVVYQHYPQLHHAKHALLESGASAALLSGSGPTLFALFHRLSDSQWQFIQSCFPVSDWNCIQTSFSPKCNR